MAKLSDHHSKTRARIMVVGDSGTGKTVALAGLANAGMRLFILDFDDGLDALRKYIKPEFHGNVEYELLRDKMRVNPAGPLVLGTPEAFSKAMNALDRWIKDTGPDDVIVVDTLTNMGAAAMNWVLHLGKRWGQKQLKRPRDWLSAMDRQEAAIAELTGPDVKANVVVNAHLAWLGDDDGGSDKDDDEEGTAAVLAAAAGGSSGFRSALNSKRYPSALGKKLPPRIATYFNCVVQTKTIGAGPNARRVIRTVPEPDVDIKVPVLPGKLPAELPVGDGLLRILNAIRDDATEEKKAA